MSFQVYNASAGSGKTYTLTKEYLKIILNAHENDAYKKILAITFTNKAVEEMKHRIIESLIHFADPITNQKSENLLQDIVSDLKLDEAFIKQKSAKILKNIIHNFASFDVTTIDKFTLRIIKTFTTDLNLPANFEVILDTEDLLKQAIEIVLSQAGHDKDLTQVLVDFVKQKADDDKSWNISEDIFQICRLILNEEHLFKFNQYETKNIADFQITKSQVVKKQEVLTNQIKNLIKPIISDFESNQITEKDLNRGTFYKHIFSLFNQSEVGLEKNYLETEIKPIAKSTKKAIILDLIPSWLAILEKVYPLNNQYYLLQLVKNNLVPVSLINSVYKEYKQLQEEENGLSIADFNTIIHNQIKDQPAPFIYERIGSKYEHYFIDEFQDTSELQWQNFVPLIANAVYSEDFQGKKGSLMLVGDPKQAIYRFRGGKAEQFINISDENQNEPFPYIQKSVKNLDTNYRSFDQVINFNNQFFKHIAAQFDNINYSNLYENLSHQKANNNIGGKVTINFVTNQEDEPSEGFLNEETDDNETDFKKLSIIDKKILQKTLQIINQCINEGFALSDMVLLTRNKKNGVFLANYLTENHIDIISSETLLIQNAAEVVFIINFLEYLNNPNNLEAKTNAFYFIANNLLNLKDVHGFLNEAKNLNYQETETFLAQYQFEISFQKIKTKSLYDTVENLISVFIPTKATNSYVLYFTDLVLERDIKLQETIANFLTFWHQIGFKKSIPSPNGLNAISIMTIHKAKGLEFPVVIYTFANEQITDRKPKVWVNVNDKDIDMQEALISKGKNFEKLNPETEAINYKKDQELKLDTINIVYVALTRAKEQLHVVSSFSITKKNAVSNANNVSKYFISYLENHNLFNIDQLEYSFGESRPIINSETDLVIRKSEKNFKINKEIQPVKENLQFSAIKIAKKEALIWGTKQKEAIEFGNIIHEIMSYIKYKTDVNDALNKSLANGLITENDLAFYQETINQIINHVDLQDFFKPENIVLNEHNIISKNQNSKPDRVEVNQSNAFLLDYKTGSHEAKYETQLKNYQKALEEMNFIVVKKCLVYIAENIKVIPL